jgi:hypothetical protein
MTIKLRFDKHPVFASTRVWTDDPSLAWVAGMLDSDLQTPEIARESAQQLRDVISGRRKPFEGSGNGFFTRVNAKQTEVGIDDRDDPITVTVSTTDLVAAIEEWAAHLEQRLKTTGSYL